MTGLEFEHECGKILRMNGFYNVEVTKGSGDQGIDVIAYKNGKKYGIQCKYYTSPVGNKAVQEAYSGARFFDCDYSAVMTNQSFTKSAIELAQKNGVLLWGNTEVGINGVSLEHPFLRKIYRIGHLIMLGLGILAMIIVVTASPTKSNVIRVLAWILAPLFALGSGMAFSVISIALYIFNILAELFVTHNQTGLISMAPFFIAIASVVIKMIFEIREKKTQDYNDYMSMMQLFMSDDSVAQKEGERENIANDELPEIARNCGYEMGRLMSGMETGKSKREIKREAKRLAKAAAMRFEQDMKNTSRRK